MEKLKWFLYFIAIMCLFIPISIVLMSDNVTYSSTFSNVVITMALVLVILGKMIDIYEKKKESKSYATDIGIIIGLSIVLVIRIF